MSNQPTKTNNELTINKMYNVTHGYKWASDSPDKFTDALQSPEMMDRITHFTNRSFGKSKETVNMAVKEINQILCTAAKNAGIAKTSGKMPKKKIYGQWFDTECKNVRKELRELSNLKHRHPHDTDLRKKYFQTQKNYKQTIKSKKQQHTNNLICTIEESINKNQFWDMWNNLNIKDPKDIPIQNGNIWLQHFQTLYTEIHPTETNQNYITQKLHNFELVFKDNQNPLDFPISSDELLQKIRSLKSNKSCGPDRIRSEMLKHSTPEMQSAMLKLFNLVLSSGFFPDIWNEGIITPIHKSGNKLDPNNYRGICVNSNLGKVFCSILNERIQTFLNKHDSLCKNQIGFLPNHRTTDHIYTLHTLINKHVKDKKNGKIFACFVDFKKAFDSIWHNGLYYKLLETGVGGKTYDVIKSMYSNNKCSIKIGKKQTEFFRQERGVRQGCSLSPTLFNIYINELAVQLGQSAGLGLTLQNTEIKFLLFADDLVLLSPTEQGLQHHLDLLASYCQTWALTVNPTKTKIMIFQKKPRCQENRYLFTLGSTALEHTMQYTYLGLIITASGSFSKAVNALKEKARRALYAIKSKFYDINIPISIWCKLFDSIIQPIALYGSEVWGPLSMHDYTAWDKHPIETLHVEFCRSILKVQIKTPNNACRAELGRYPLAIPIQKRALKFWMHLKSSPKNTLQFEALNTQELNPTKSPLCQLVLKLTNPLTTTNTHQAQTSTASEPRICVKTAIKQEKENYLEHWKNQTTSQSRMNFYLTLNREYKLAEYLLSVRDAKQRQILTKYRLSDHTLAVETGRHRKTWLPKEDRICGNCQTGEVETEVHFLLQCTIYENIRQSFFNDFEACHPGFGTLETGRKLSILSGEGPLAPFAAKYISQCHLLRESLSE